jgi:hypothetical protein
VRQRVRAILFGFLLGIAALAELGVQRRPKYPKMNKTTTMTPMM